MFNNLTPGKVILFVQRIVTLTFTWPPPSTATKFQVLRFKTLQRVTIVSASLLLLPLIYAIYLQRNDLIEVTKSASLTFSIAKIIIQTAYCIKQYDNLQILHTPLLPNLILSSRQKTEELISLPRDPLEFHKNREFILRIVPLPVDLLQGLIGEMTAYLETAEPFEQIIFQRYINKYSKFYGVAAMWFYTTSFTVIVGTLFIAQPFPTRAEYPFAVDYEPMKTIIFLHQALVGIQVPGGLCVNVYVALLVLFASARFEILTEELRHTNDVHSLAQCLKKYYITRRYAERVISVVQYITLIAIVVSTLSLLMIGISLLQKIECSEVPPLFYSMTSLEDILSRDMALVPGNRSCESERS
ncbi:uncharacterized protein LOC143181409 [Calliopsis andreniformis]|uniref:uncharacterized protein LOC143181409 n=1 Tax=Calliopsis andreniformis TaxID=337506 RepID=UPI003FCE48FA